MNNIYLKCINFKKYMKCSKALVLIFCLFFFKLTNPQNKIEHQLPDIVVTASRTPITFSNLTRSVEIIDEKTIQSAPVTNIQDLLQYVLGVDVRQRGVEGVQADVSIRGGTFEQTLILIDGLKLSDPQTGHHNLNIPVGIDNIDRIEILKGQGSKIYGPNAFSGVINIITKKSSHKSISLLVLGGQNGHYEGGANLSYSLGILNNHVSISRKKADGYVHNTNFEMTNFSYGSNFNMGNDKINFLFGYNDKRFGANGFYSDRFPNQWEHTTTKFLSLGGEIKNENFSIAPKAYWRRHDDNFLLDYLRPSFYENIHQTNVYGVELQSSLQTDLGITSLGGEFTKDKIESTNLGNHSRESKGVFAEHKFSLLKDFTFIAGGFLYNYATIGWKFWPGFDFAYNIISNARLYGSIGKAFRVPTYTELYYSDPASKGSKDLKYEETLNYEIGFNYTQLSYNFNLSLFRKEGKNIIDWVRTQNEQLWIARNIAQINTNGIEFNFNFDPKSFIDFIPVYNLGINYTYLDIDKELGDLESRYLLDHLRHQIIINISNYLPFDIMQGWALRYEDRINFEDHFLIDTQFMREFQSFNIFIKATNLLNKSYKDVTSVALPGRWIIAGVKLKLLL